MFKIFIIIYFNITKSIFLLKRLNLGIIVFFASKIKGDNVRYPISIRTFLSNLIFLSFHVLKQYLTILFLSKRSPQHPFLIEFSFTGLLKIQSICFSFLSFECVEFMVNHLPLIPYLLQVAVV